MISANIAIFIMKRSNDIPTLKSSPINNTIKIMVKIDMAATPLRIVYLKSLTDASVLRFKSSVVLWSDENCSEKA